jgi:hypothetical protein
LATEYGFAEGFFRGDNELWKLFQAATKGQWSATKFQGEFMKTAWFRARQASIRQWADLTIRDPAEAEAKIVERIADMSDQFTQLGVNLDAGTIRSLATQSLQYQWSQNQVSNVLANYVQYVPGQTGGGIAALETRIKGLAYDYGVTVTNEQMQQWIQGMIAQTYTEDNVKDFVTDAARAKYTGYTKQLDAGRTMRDIAGQHIAKFSELLEVDPEQVSLDDPVLAKALQGQVDPKTGLPVTQSVFQLSQQVKQDKRWLGTKNARDEMTTATLGVLKDMGLV